MTEATPTQKGKARWALVAVLVVGSVIGLGAVASNAALRGLVEQGERSEQLLARLEAQAYRMSALEWQSIAQSEVTSETVENVRSIRADSTSIVRELERRHVGERTLDPVYRAYETYAAAVDEEFALIAAGRLDQARLFDTRTVDPSFSALREAIAPAGEAFGTRARWLERLSIVGFAVVLLFANVATVGLFWGYQRARDRTERAIAEQDSLAQREENARLLGEMGDRLRSSETPAEVYETIAQSALQLFPSDSGVLYVLDRSTGTYKATASWGLDPGYLPEPAFGSSDCMALRTGRPYWMTNTADGPVCEHVRRSGSTGYLCVPLMSERDAVGVLHFDHFGSLQKSRPVESAVTSRRRLAIAAAESISLELANMRLQEALRDQATHDSLSGLCNRRFMEATFDRELARAARHHTPISVLMVDVDRFKSINDVLGHAAGDSAIVQLSDLLRNSFRGEDIVCRYGGDEFVVVLPGTTLEDARGRAERLQEEVRRVSSETSDAAFSSLTLSLGIAAYPQHGTTIDSLIDAADAAMYQAKANGRDRMVVAPDDRAAGVEREDREM